MRGQNVRKIIFSFYAVFTQIVRRKIAEALRGNVFTQMRAKSRGYLPQKLRITPFGLCGRFPIEGLK